MAHDGRIAPRATPRRPRPRGAQPRVLLCLTLLLASCTTASSAAARPPAAPAATASAPAATAAPLVAVRVAVPTIDLSNLPLAIGLWKGWYRDAGLDVELVRIGGQAALPALLNGEVSYLFGWSAASGGIVQGAPIKILAILLDRPPHVVVAQPDVQAVAALRGRRVASSRAGGTDDLIIEHALRTAGLRPDDVEMVRLGETSTRYSALVAGQVDAAALIQPFTADAEKQGLHVLVHGDDILLLPVGIIGTSQAHLAAAPAEAPALLGVVARSLAYVRDRANRPEIVRLATAHLDLDPTLAEVMVDEALSTVSPNGEAPSAVLDGAIDVARRQADKPEPISLANVVDFSLLRAARQAAGEP